jgi:hypothetical protein
MHYGGWKPGRGNGKPVFCHEGRGQCRRLPRRAEEERRVGGERRRVRRGWEKGLGEDTGTEERRRGGERFSEHVNSRSNRNNKSARNYISCGCPRLLGNPGYPGWPQRGDGRSRPGGFGAVEPCGRTGSANGPVADGTSPFTVSGPAVDGSGRTRAAGAENGRRQPEGRGGRGDPGALEATGGVGLTALETRHDETRQVRRSAWSYSSLLRRRGRGVFRNRDG